LKAETLRVDQWREKKARRDAVRLAISGLLYSDKTGLPAVYADQEVKALSEGVFQYVFMRIQPCRRRSSDHRIPGQAQRFSSQTKNRT
jgi:hypothetical protein